MRAARLPEGLFMQTPNPPALPIRAIGAIVQDSQGQQIATCPNSSLADFVAWSINVLNEVHPA